MKDIFISYSRRDSDKVNHFVDKLINEGYSVWIDKDGIESGDQFKLIIVKAIEESKVVLFFSSEASNASAWTAKEIGIANARQKPIIPIKLDQSSYNRQVEFDLINNDFVDFSEGLDNEHALKKLLKSIAKKCRAEEQKDCLSEEISQQRKTGRKSTTLWIALVIVSVVVVIGAMLMKRVNNPTSLRNPEESQATTIIETSLDTTTLSSPVVDQVPAVSEQPRQAEQKSESRVDPVKEYQTGLDFFTGKGVDIDYEEASKHLLLAADAGNSDAQYVVGRMFYHGVVNHDYSKAVKYFKKSAAQGNASAAYYLSTCYLNGLGVPQDDARMLENLLSAANKGGFQARADLCSYYLIGFHVEKNVELAEKYYHLAKQDDSFNLSTLEGIDNDFYFKMRQDSLEDKWKEIQKEKSSN